METLHTKFLKMHKLLSLITILAGFLLMIFMIAVEGEPGAIPLLLITAGTIWYFTSQCKKK